MEIDLLSKGLSLIAGIDEVGRGPLAGPVVACSTLLFDVEQDDISEAYFYELFEGLAVNDSKKLSEAKRRKLLSSLNIAVSELKPDTFYSISKGQGKVFGFALSEINADTIDEINILEASLLAMRKSFRQAFEQCEVRKWHGTVLVDGNQNPNIGIDNIRTRTIVQGDSKSKMIALASIIAKEYRDYKMSLLDKKYPGYELAKHAGYPTPKHKELIAKLGPSEIHRKSFKGVREHLN